MESGISLWSSTTPTFLTISNIIDHLLRPPSHISTTYNNDHVLPVLLQDHHCVSRRLLRHQLYVIQADSTPFRSIPLHTFYQLPVSVFSHSTEILVSSVNRICEDCVHGLKTNLFIGGEAPSDHWMVERLKNVINGTESMHPIIVSRRRKLRRNDTDTSRTMVLSSRIISDNCTKTPLPETIEIWRTLDIDIPHF